MKLLFSDMAEFLEELQADAVLLERGIVRVTIHRRWHGSPVQEELYLVATCVLVGRLTELRHAAGGGFVMGGEADAELHEARKKARRLLEELQEHLAEMDVQVRAGYLVENLGLTT